MMDCRKRIRKRKEEDIEQNKKIGLRTRTKARIEKCRKAD